MYPALLANRYLRSRIIPLIAMAAVALCVALVIIVVSVMTGFLDMVKSSGRRLMGDVSIVYPIQGLPHYESLIARLDQLPEVDAATPIVEGLGVMKMPYGRVEGVQFWGIDVASFTAVTGYADSIHWKTLQPPDAVLPEDASELDRVNFDRAQMHWRLVFRDMMADHQAAVLERIPDMEKLAILREAMIGLEIGTSSLDSIPVEQQLAWAVSRDELAWREAFSFLRVHPDVFKATVAIETWEAILEIEPRLARAGVIEEEGLALQATGSDGPAACIGIHVSSANDRQRDGTYDPIGAWFMPRFEVTLTTLPIDREGDLADPEPMIFQIVNEFVSGVYVVDDKRVFIPIESAQALLHLDEQIEVDEDTFEEIGRFPSRATSILVRAAPDVTPEALKAVVQKAYDAFFSEMSGRPDIRDLPPPRTQTGVQVLTWLEQQAQLIGPVEKERELMRTLFSIVYVVCSALVLSIFWAIVFEKTRDIGILRAIGASRVGIAMIFLRYGAVIGVIGAILGFGLAWLILQNIQTLHDGLGAKAPPIVWGTGFVLSGLAMIVMFITMRRGFLLPVVLWAIAAVVLLISAVALMLHKGTLIWDPSIYYFTTIPNEIDPVTAVTTMIGAVIFSVLGAVVPAAKAADTDPVKALRYE